MSLPTARGIIDRALAEARRDGYLMALAELEREIYSAETIDEVWRWIAAALRNAPQREGRPKA
jgi:hypothetical protein